MKIAVGLSGGVDSSAAAALLHEQGHDVVGVTMVHAQGLSFPKDVEVSACFGGDEEQELEEAREAARHIGIPFHVVDLTKEYQEIVISYFRSEYLAGRTPNPCIRCNQKIKFELLADKLADHVPFDYFATGHYARIMKDSKTGRYLLMRGKDRSKDQSYFLSQLRQHQLERIMFPLGDLTKEEVRNLARSFSLPSAEKTESQDFYSGDYRDLFDEPPGEGDILDMDGNVIGTHKGIVSYTIGQRRGLGIASPVPLYVVAIDSIRNAVIAGPKEALIQQGLTAVELNWFIDIEAAEFPLRATAKIRHGLSEHRASVMPHGEERYLVVFDRPLTAVTPGQGVVCYQDDIVLGGGFIEGPWDGTDYS